MSYHTQIITSDQIQPLRQFLANEGFVIGNQPYCEFVARNGKTVATLYSKKFKLLIQGPGTSNLVSKLAAAIRTTVRARGATGSSTVGDELAKVVTSLSEDSNVQKTTSAVGTIRIPAPLIRPILQEIPQPHFGVDESGKGDLFGPLVIAGAYVDANLKLELEALGVRDSKSLNDSQISEMAPRIRDILPHSVVTVEPEIYNNWYTTRFGDNLNQLLAWGHAQVIENLVIKVPNCGIALSDQFAKDTSLIKKYVMTEGQKVDLRQMTNGERDPAVAAASILARSAFIRWMTEAQNKHGVNLPKGCGPHVKTAAKLLFNKVGEEMYSNLVKMHFKTNDSILGRAPKPAKRYSYTRKGCTVAKRASAPRKRKASASPER